MAIITNFSNNGRLFPEELPGGYWPCEYLESTGTQWIDTGYIHNSTTWVELYACPTSWYNYNTFFGAGTSDNASDTLTFGVNGGGMINVDIGAGFNNVCCKLPVNTQSKLVFSGTRINVNDGESTYTINKTVGTPKYSIALFTRHLSSGYTSEIGKARIYGCKIYEGTHENISKSSLIRNFIPALDDTGTPCMYDLVEHKPYYNGGTGTFQYKKKYLLMQGFRWCDYIEGTGTQYINAGFVPDSTTTVEMSFNTGAYQNNTTFFGQGWSGSQYLFIKQSNYYKFYGGGGNVSSLCNYCDAIIKITSDNKFIFTSNGTTTTSSISRACATTGNLYIFATNSGGYKGSFRLYYLKVWKNNGTTLIRDFVPCLSDSGKPCLYDKVSQQFYFNIGTGDFSYKLKKQTIADDLGYVSNGLELMFDVLIEEQGTKNYITNLMTNEKHQIDTDIDFTGEILNLKSKVFNVSHSASFVNSDQYHVEFVGAVEKGSTIVSSVYSLSGRYYSTTASGESTYGSGVRILNISDRSGAEKNSSAPTTAKFISYTDQEMAELASYSFKPYGNVSSGSLKRNNETKTLSNTGIATTNKILRGTGGFNGKFACLRVYSRELSDAEIKQNYEVDKKRFNLS